jgi:very-short-patch-repair endonuclease
LLDLSTANRLLDAKVSRTCIEVPNVDPVKLAAALAAGNAFAVEAGTDPGFETGRLRVPLATADLERRLVTIRRAARSQLADSGEHTLWLALGMLVWRDASHASHMAPLALWPVELERTEGGTLRLVAADGIEPWFNAMLGEKLRRDFDVLLAPPAGELDLAGLLDAAEGITVTRPGWCVERSARLGCFSFAKFALWRDLDARGDDLLASPVVAHLSLGSGIAFPQPSGEAAGAVTSQRGASGWASELLAPLDADASQLHAVAAAGAGASFVLQGPPGTGKSQTIANLIGHCVGHGKSVLVVSHKVAALDDVQQRLASVGLGEFCLELTSSDRKATRAKVVAQLGRVLERTFRPGSGPNTDDRLVELRAALDGHASALHRIGAFGRSLHDVLGRLVELRTTPRAALADPDAIGLDAATFERRRVAVEDLATAAIPVEPVASHPWQASTLDLEVFLTGDGRQRALTAIDEAAAAAASLHAAVRDVASLVPGLVARTREQLQALGALAALAATSPRPGGELLTHLRSSRQGEAEIAEQIALIRARGAGVVEVPRDPLAFLTLANRHRLLVTEVGDAFTDAVADLDAASLWAQLRKWTNSMAPIRFVALRNARAEVKAAAIPMQLETDAAMITALEAVLAERACRVALQGAAEPAKRWFGELGHDPAALELDKIDSAVVWAADLRRAFDAVDVIGGDGGRNAAWRSLVAQVAANPTGSVVTPIGPAPADLAVFANLAEAVARWVPALAALAEATGIDRAELGAGDDHLATLRERTETLRHAVDSLRDWVAFYSARHHALSCGVGPAVQVLARGDLAAAELALAWERATLLAWAEAELASDEALAGFHGAAHHAHVSAFADLDRAALALVRSRTLARLAERVPQRRSSEGELGVLLEELARARAGRELRPLRELFAAMPAILPRVAPCMLMTPLSVAQYLDPALARFDIVVFDEASQLPTADAIGALARGDAAVIVGDSRQLPPTRVIEAQTSEDESEAVVAQLESVLDDCITARLPELRLAWHYRSRHEDLIAFANQRYYGDRLQVFPTSQGSPDLGVVWRRIEGTCDRDTRQNRVEAEAIVAEVVARLRDPAQRTRSLGVITFSRAQQELIEDLLDLVRAGDSTIDAAFESDQLDLPVLVKNVETAQGDERDVILLSVGFGPDAGPQSLDERRLAVAITRAREQLVVFSSFAPEDIAADAPGALRDLAALIAFARSGGGAARPLDDTPASPITNAIARALNERGWVLRHQVGCGAYKVDLAVVDPNDPERHVLAIEHDGAAYASAPAARDRDRLRAQVLAQLGWRLHRIWSLDWWLDPEREIQRTHAAIVTAIAATRQRRASSVPAPKQTSDSSRVRRAAVPVVKIPPKQQPSLEAEAPVEAIDSATLPTLAAGSSPVRLPRNAIPIGPYTAAAIPPGRRTPDDLFAPRHLAELGKIVEQVLAAEAPMHVDVLARRVGAYFGIGRVTQRVTDQVRIALEGRGRWGDEQNVIWRLDQDPSAVPPVRVAPSGQAGHSPVGRRDIAEIPLSELAAAVRIVVERALGAAPPSTRGIATNDLVRDAARLMGFARITELVTERVAQGVRLAQVRELIKIESGKATLPPD